MTEFQDPKPGDDALLFVPDDIMAIPHAYITPNPGENHPPITDTDPFEVNEELREVSTELLTTLSNMGIEEAQTVSSWFAMPRHDETPLYPSLGVMSAKFKSFSDFHFDAEMEHRYSVLGDFSAVLNLMALFSMDHSPTLYREAEASIINLDMPDTTKDALLVLLGQIPTKFSRLRDEVGYSDLPEPDSES